MFAPGPTVLCPPSFSIVFALALPRNLKPSEQHCGLGNQFCSYSPQHLIAIVHPLLVLRASESPEPQWGPQNLWSAAVCLQSSLLFLGPPGLSVSTDCTVGAMFSWSTALFESKIFSFLSVHEKKNVSYQLKINKFRFVSQGIHIHVIKIQTVLKVDNKNTAELMPVYGYRGRGQQALPKGHVQAAVWFYKQCFLRNSDGHYFLH